MIIVRRLSGQIITHLHGFLSAKPLYGRIMGMTENPRDGEYYFNYSLTRGFKNEQDGEKVLNWIFEQMKAQKDAVNIITDMKECPFLNGHEKEGEKEK